MNDPISLLTYTSQKAVLESWATIKKNEKINVIQTAGKSALLFIKSLYDSNGQFTNPMAENTYRPYWTSYYFPGFFAIIFSIIKTLVMEDLSGHFLLTSDEILFLLYLTTVYFIPIVLFKDLSSFESYNYYSSSSEIEKDRHFLETKSVSQDQDYSTDHLVKSASSSTDLPLPPGITEITLENSEAVFREIKKYLIGVRNFHRIVFTILIVTFLLFAGIGFYKLLGELDSFADYFKMLGSFGLGGSLLYFVRNVLYDHRVTQLSLALFESYILEINQSLATIPKDLSFEEALEARGKIWSKFREGLNNLWENEKKAKKESDSKKGKK